MDILYKKVKQLFYEKNIEHLIFDKSTWKNGIPKVER